MQPLALATLCHRAILTEHLQLDPYITLREHLELVSARLHSCDAGSHADSYHSLVVRQAEEAFWCMSSTKAEVMSVFSVVNVLHHPTAFLLRKAFQPWGRRCRKRTMPY